MKAGAAEFMFSLCFFYLRGAFCVKYSQYFASNSSADRENNES